MDPAPFMSYAQFTEMPAAVRRLVAKEWGHFGAYALTQLSDNYFCPEIERNIWYRSLIAGSPSNKRALVVSDPEAAFSVFALMDDAEGLRTIAEDTSLPPLMRRNAYIELGRQRLARAIVPEPRVQVIQPLFEPPRPNKSPVNSKQSTSWGDEMSPLQEVAYRVFEDTRE